VMLVVISVFTVKLVGLLEQRVSSWRSTAR
jgi:hypothetical protein